MSRTRWFLLSCVLLVSATRSAEAQWAVADAANLVQNTMTALKTAQTVVNTLQQIELMKSQIQNQLQTLRSIDPTTITGLQQLLSAGQLTFSMIQNDVSSIRFDIADVNRDFAKLFPKSQSQWQSVQYSDFNGYYDRWNGEITASSLAASRAQGSIAGLDANNRAIASILASSRDATGEVRQLQLANQQLALIHTELVSLVQNLATMGRVTSDWAAASVGENMIARERARRRLDGYTSRGKPARTLNRLP